MLVKKFNSEKLRRGFRCELNILYILDILICYVHRLEIHYYWRYVRNLKYFCLFGYYVRF